MGADLLGHGQRLLVGYRLHLSLAQGGDGRVVVPQIELGADQDDGHTGRMVFDFGEPLDQEGVSGWR